MVWLCQCYFCILCFLAVRCRRPHSTLLKNKRARFCHNRYTECSRTIAKSGCSNSSCKITTFTLCRLVLACCDPILSDIQDGRIGFIGTSWTPCTIFKFHQDIVDCISRTTTFELGERIWPHLFFGIPVWVHLANCSKLICISGGTFSFTGIQFWVLIYVTEYRKYVYWLASQLCVWEICVHDLLN